MNKITYTIVGIALIMLQSCQKEPTACFNSSVTTAQAGDAISFTNCSTEGDHFTWEFGDGQTANAPTTSHVYANAGTYTVKMTAFSANDKKTDVATSTVTITPATGRVSFWQSGTPAYYYTDVIIGTEIHTISSDYAFGIADCLQSGCANYELAPGTYSFFAAEQSPYTGTWSGNVTVTQHGCSTMQLQ